MFKSPSVLSVCCFYPTIFGLNLVRMYEFINFIVLKRIKPTITEYIQSQPHAVRQE